MTCKICGIPDYKYIGKPRSNRNFPYSIGSEYKIFKCTNCGYYYISPDINLDQKEWESLYKDGYFNSYNVSEWQKDLHKKEREYRFSLIKKYSKYTIRKFLDFGSGAGLVLQEALKEGYETYGLDIADNLNESINRKSINFFQGNILDANYQSDFFDVIYMDSVLEHTPNPMTILKELNRILKPAGSFYLVVPNEDCLINSFKKVAYYGTFNKEKYGKIKPFVSPYHVQGFNKKSLKTALLNAGFKILHLSNFGGNYKFWKAYPFFSKYYLFELLLYPIGLISIILKKQIQLQSLVIKE